MTRTEDAGRAIVESALAVALKIAAEHDVTHGAVIDATLDILGEIAEGHEDHEAFEAAVLAKLEGHDPETRA